MATTASQEAASLPEDADELDQLVAELSYELGALKKSIARAKAVSAKDVLTDYVEPTLAGITERLRDMVLLVAEDIEELTAETIVLRTAFVGQIALATANAEALLLAQRVIEGDAAAVLKPIAERVVAKAALVQAAAQTVAAQLGVGDDGTDDEDDEPETAGAAGAEGSNQPATDRDTTSALSTPAPLPFPALSKPTAAATDAEGPHAPQSTPLTPA